MQLIALMHFLLVSTVVALGTNELFAESTLLNGPIGYIFWVLSDTTQRCNAPSPHCLRAESVAAVYFLWCNRLQQVRACTCSW